MKALLESILKLLAKAIIHKYKPRVIGITGSVGKTSTKDAVVAVLKDRFVIRETYKNYNNELGVPLTIIGAKAYGKNIFGWLGVFAKALHMLIVRVSYPQILILEMGADKPGDIDELTDIAPVSIGILTAVSEAHLHEFKTVEKVLTEKEKIVTKIKVGRAILNADDVLVASVADHCKANVTTIGIETSASMRAIEISLYGLDDPTCTSDNRFECTTWGTTFKVSHAGSAVPFFLPHVIGRPAIYATLCAIAVGIELGMNLLEISQVLEKFVPPRGRMNVLSGAGNSLLIDDTYNSSPRATMELLGALPAVRALQKGRMIGFFGDMLELGDESDALHKQLGKQVAQAGFTQLICVGANARLIGEGAVQAGMSKEAIFYFENSQGVGEQFVTGLAPGDTVVIKGSQGARMERITKALLLDQSKADELLVRQDWKN